MLTKTILKTLLPTLKSYLPSVKDNIMKLFSAKEKSVELHDGDYFAYVITRTNDTLILSDCVFDNDDKLKRVIESRNIETTIEKLLNEI